jgi:hypothetical protein
MQCFAIEAVWADDRYLPRQFGKCTQSYDVRFNRA